MDNGLIDQWVEFFPQFLPGLAVTLELTVAALAIGLPLGVILAVSVSSRGRPLRWTAVVLVEFGRGLPGLLVLYLVYFGLPQIGIALPNFFAAAVALALSTGAYTSEIFRAGILAVPAGHREAARALGLSPWKELRLVVLPQAIRTVIPPLVGFAIILYQGTSLAFAISTPELLSVAYNTASITFQFTAALTLAGLMYAVVSLVAVALISGRGTGRRLTATTDTELRPILATPDSSPFPSPPSPRSPLRAAVAARPARRRRPRTASRSTSSVPSSPGR